MPVVFLGNHAALGVLPAVGVAGDQQASLIGQETVGFPISPLTGSFYLLTGLAGVDIGAHIKHLIGYAWLLSLIMLGVAVLTGAIPVWS